MTWSIHLSDCWHLWSLLIEEEKEETKKSWGFIMNYTFISPIKLFLEDFYAKCRKKYNFRCHFQLTILFYKILKLYQGILPIAQLSWKKWMNAHKNTFKREKRKRKLRFSSTFINFATKCTQKISQQTKRMVQNNENAVIMHVRWA